MQLTESRLRKLVESILAEGLKDDSEFLSAKYDYPVESLTPKHVQWLMPRFGDNASIPPGHSFSDVIETLNTFIKESGVLSSKYRDNETFRSDIDRAFPAKKWGSPADFLTMSSDDMVKILDMSKKKKQRFKITDTSLPTGDFVGEIGKWQIWIASSKENICKIVGFDPVTMEPNTDWCTARTGGSNLFYNYLEEDSFDFQVKKVPPTGDADDFINLGYKDKKLLLPSKNGGRSVNRANVGLTESLCIQIFGNETFEAIKALTMQYMASVNYKNPAFSKIEDAAQNVEALEYLIKGISKDEASDIKKKILKIETISTDVLSRIAGDKDSFVRIGVAQNINVPVDVLMMLAGDEDSFVRIGVAQNPKTPVDVLRVLAGDKDSYVHSCVAQNINVPVDVLMKLAGDEDSVVRSVVAKNLKTPVDVMMKLADDEDRYVRSVVAKNINVPVDVLIKLADDEYGYVRSCVAQNINVPDNVLMKLADDEDMFVRYTVRERLKSKNNLSETLIRLIRAIIIN